MNEGKARLLSWEGLKPGMTVVQEFKGSDYPARVTVLEEVRPGLLKMEREMDSGPIFCYRSSFYRYWDKLPTPSQMEGVPWNA